VNFAEEIELETNGFMESPELAFRFECLERRLGNLEAWLGELGSDMLDRFNIAPMDEDCEKERMGS
jgi:hypothetical protein